MSDYKIITPPLTDKDVASLRAGDRVLITGYIYTARDAAHKRMMELIKKGEDLPFDVKGQIIYYVGPAPAKPGYVIGSAGPTTASRMDPFTPQLLKLGLKGMIGKGQRSEEVKKALKEYKAVYFEAVGGTGALLARRIKSVEIIAYEDLGPEAIRKLYVEEFPVIVAVDMYGNDLFIEGRKAYSRL